MQTTDLMTDCQINYFDLKCRGQSDTDDAFIVHEQLDLEAREWLEHSFSSEVAAHVWIAAVTEAWIKEHQA